MPSPEQLDRLIERHKAAHAKLTDRTSARIARIWDRLGSWDLADIERFVAEIADVIDASQLASQRLATAFYSRTLGVPLEAAEAVNVTYKADQAFHAMWHALAEGRPFDEALAAGRSQTEAQVSNFLTSTARRTGTQAVEKSGMRVKGWKRVPSAGACSWCVTVAGQTYHTAETADFGHDRCDCTAVPVVA